MEQPVGGTQSRPLPAGLGDVLRHSLTYMTGNVAYKAVALLAIPFLARLLTPAELGLLDLAALIASVVALIAGVGIETAAARFQPSESAGRLWVTAAFVVAAAAGGSVLVGLIAAEVLATGLIGSGSRTTLVAAAVIYGAVHAGVGFALTFVRLTDRPAVYARYAFVIVAAEMVAAIAIASTVAQPVPAVVWGWTGASIIGVAYLFWRQRMPVARFDGDLARRLVRFGAPLVPAAIVWIGAELGVRAVIANVSDLNALGSYGIAARLVSVLGLFVAAFGLAWHPYVFKLSRDRVVGESQRALVQVVGGMGVVAIALSTVGPEAVLLVAGGGYERAAQAIPPMAAGMVALGVMTMMAGVVALERGTGAVAATSALGAAIQVGMAILLVPGMGLSGAAFATGVGYAVSAIFLLGRSQFLRLPARAGLMVTAVTVILIGSMYVMSSLESAPVILRAPVGLVMSAVLAGSCYLALKGLGAKPRVPVAG